MDPDACVDRLLGALEEGDREDAENSAEDLLGWLRKGGFEPRRSAGQEITNQMLVSFEPEELENVCRLISWLQGSEEPE